MIYILSRLVAWYPKPTSCPLVPMLLLPRVADGLESPLGDELLHALPCHLPAGFHLPAPCTTGSIATKLVSVDRPVLARVAVEHHTLVEDPQTHSLIRGVARLTNVVEDALWPLGYAVVGGGVVYVGEHVVEAHLPDHRRIHGLPTDHVVLEGAHEAAVEIEDVGMPVGKPGPDDEGLGRVVGDGARRGVEGVVVPFAHQRAVVVRLHPLHQDVALDAGEALVEELDVYYSNSRVRPRVSAGSTLHQLAIGNGVHVLWERVRIMTILHNGVPRWNIPVLLEGPGYPGGSF